MVAAAAVWWRKREAREGLRTRPGALLVLAPVLLLIVPAPALGAPEHGFTHWWAVVAPSLRRRLRFDQPRIAVEAAMRRTSDALIDAFDLFGDHRARIALWVAVAVLGGVGVTFLISQSTQ